MYISSYSEANGQENNPDRRYGTGEYRFTLADPDRQIFGGAEEKVINFEIERRGKLVGRMWVCAMIVDANGVVVAQCDSRLVGFWVEDCPRISGQVRFTTPWLKPGRYRVDLSVGAPWTMDYWEGACSLLISPVLPYSNSAGSSASAHGLVFADFSWAASNLKTQSVSTALQDDGNSKVPQIST